MAPNKNPRKGKKVGVSKSQSQAKAVDSVSDKTPSSPVKRRGRAPKRLTMFHSSKILSSVNKQIILVLVQIQPHGLIPL